MPSRVHELAKELKISTTALKKHLSDLGVKVKSHMSIVEDDVSIRIRKMFDDQVKAVKMMETDRKRLHTPRPKAVEEPTPVAPEPVAEPVKETVEHKPAAPAPKSSEEPVAKEKAPAEPQADESSKPEYLKNFGKNLNPRTDNRPTDNRPSNDNRGGQRPDNRGGAQRPYDNRSSQRPDNRGGGDNRPSYDNRGGQRPDNRSGDNRPPYDNRGGQRPDNRGGAPRPYDNRSGQRPDNRGGDSRPPYDNRGGQRPDNRGGAPRPYDNRGGQRPDNRGGDSRPPYDNRGGQRPDNRAGGAPRPYDNRGGAPRGTRPTDGRPGFDKDKFGKDEAFRPRASKPAGPPKPKDVTELGLAKIEPKRFDKKKKADDYGDESRHIQAKKKKMKTEKQKYTVIEVDEAETSKAIKTTLLKKKKKKYEKKVQSTSHMDEKQIVIAEFTSVSELAKMMDINPTEIISRFFKMGQMVTINQRLDKDSLEMICDEFGFDFEFEDEYGTELLSPEEERYENAEDEPRAPVVTIMGHVDHGKTSILDYIRHTKVVAGESGGITQHIGAYQIEHKGTKITFLDTPGHAAFTAMRSRGAQLTDIAVIVVAANDGVMPQTKEAIDHAKAAGVDMIVAINKIDLPDANIDKAIAGLLEQGVYLDNYGGEVPWCTCSAKTGEGIDDLLELIMLSSEIKELTSKQDVPARGTVIEARMDSRMGTIVTIINQEGILRKGDSIICGATHGRLKKMENERGVEITELYPSDVARVYGINDVPKAGDLYNYVDNDKIARQISSERLQIRLEREKFTTTTNLNNLFDKIKQNEIHDLGLIVKADTDGSVEAICDSFMKLSNQEVKVNIIRKGVGGITEADVTLASASNAIIIGFHVRANPQARRLSEDEKVEIKIYQIIYDAINDVRLALEGLLSPEFDERVTGTAVVRQVFKIKKVGTIAGCFVEKGTILKKAHAIRLYRSDVLIHEGKLQSLKHFANDVSEVKAGTECGIAFENFSDIKEGDILETFVLDEVVRKLENV